MSTTDALIGGAITIGVTQAVFGRGGIANPDRGRQRISKTSSIAKYKITVRGRARIANLKRDQIRMKNSDFGHGLSDGINFLENFKKPVTEKQVLRKVTLSSSKLKQALRFNLQNGYIRRIV